MSPDNKFKDVNRETAHLGDDDLLSLMEYGNIVHSSLDSQEVFSMIMENTNKVAGSVASTLFLLDKSTGELVFSTPTGPMAEKLANMRIKKGQGIAGWVLANGEPAIVADVQQDPRFFNGIDESTGFQTKSILCIPLLLKGKVIGVIEAINKKDGTAFTEKDARLLSIFAEQTAMAIENARLHGALENQLQETLRLQGLLTEAEKNRALEKLSAGIAHDFKNILNAISGFAEILHMDAIDSKTREDLLEILKASDSAMDLVEQILAFTKQSPQEKSPTKSRKCIKQAIKLFRIFLPRGIQIQEDLTFEDGPILANSTQIHHAITQLFKNAQEAMGNRPGVLGVASRVVELGKLDASMYHGLEPGAYVKIIINDNGCGMDADTLAQAFDPYFTTKNRTVGTGMGLSAVQGIIKDHGGAVAISSTPGKGTSVEIMLPLHAEKSVPQPLALDALPRGTEHILIVDDVRLMIITLKKMLESLGYQVTTANSSEEALEIFREGSGELDLVITDWAMPEITGDRLAEMLIDIKPDTPVILYSAFDDGITRENFRPRGIRRMLKKPISMEKLAYTVRQVLEPAPET